MTKLPALHFYVGDWRKDPGVQALDFMHRGVWLEILFLMHESEDRGKLLLNGKAMPDEALARNLGLPEADTKQIVSKIEAYGVASRDDDGMLYCRRMVRDENLRRMKVKAGRLGGQKSKPPPKQVGSKHEAEGEANGGSSVSSSVSSSKENPPKGPPFETEFLEFWEQYPKKVGKKTALKVYQARRRAGVDHEDIIAGLDRHLAYKEANGENHLNPSTFLGPDELWLEPWHIPEVAGMKEPGSEEPQQIDPKFKKPFMPVIEERKPFERKSKPGGNISETLDNVMKDVS